MHIEIGGGSRALGGHWQNVDICEPADHVCDVNKGLPFEDDTVDAVYSSHCLEHLQSPHAFFREVARVCKVGATVEIRVPAPFSEMAMCAGHLHVFSPSQARHMAVEFVADWFPRYMCAKRLEFAGLPEYRPAAAFHEARNMAAFISMSDEQIMRFVPGTAHEVVYRFLVVENATS